MNTTISGSNPAITTLNNGEYVITWSLIDQTGNVDIYALRFNANGIAQGNEFKVNTFTDDYQDIPSITTLNSGDFVITWQSTNFTNFDTDIRGQRFDANGISVGTEFKINTFSEGTALSTNVATLSNGDFVVMWPSGSQDGYSTFDFGIYGQLFDSSGARKGEEFHINTFIAGNQLEPKIAALSDGGFAVTWYSEIQDGSGLGVYVQRYDANGNATNMLVNRAGNDVLAGSISDDDTVSYVNSTEAVTVSLNLNGQQNTIGAGLDTLTGIEHLVGSAFVDTLTGNNKDNVLFGGNGNDALAGWSGADTMVGGLGNDTYFVENANDVVIEKLNEGIDTVNSKVTYISFEHIENIILTGTSAIDGIGNSQANMMTGNTAANWLSGGDGNDKLVGGNGSDTLWGGNSNDTLLGGTGNDALNGGRGNDKLDGGTGNNILTGEGGNDIFKFTTTGHIDTITDYSVNSDTIQLENAVFKALTVSGTLAASHFKIGPKALDANDYVIYNSATGALIYDADGNGAGTAVQIATLVSGLNMTNVSNSDPI